MAPAAGSRRKESTFPAPYREDSSKPPMLRFQDSLPKLPVPPLEKTAARYLRSIHPLLSPLEYAHSEKVVNEFIAPNGPGQPLQKRLVERASDPNQKNWLWEYWNDTAYLSYRDPVVPYVSYFYSYRDDRKRRDPAARAAAITTAALAFESMVRKQDLQPEYMKKLPICMDSYKWMFNGSRVAAKPADYPITFDAESHRFIVVVRKNAFFKVATEVDGQQLNAKELEAQLRKIYEMAREPVEPVGALTSENRDVWTDARATLLAASEDNKVAVETIESSSFIVCLDDAAPESLEERAHSYWHGDGMNRWYDKPLEFIVNDNGTAGFIGEHSMMDGMPTQRLNDYINNVITEESVPGLTASSARSNLPDPEPINFKITREVEKDIHKAKKDFEHVIGKHELAVQAYDGYGKNKIKELGFSPDAYVQMMIQLAYYKMYGRNRPTYESATTRRFQLGRTETCRSVSDASVAWCNAMADKQKTQEQRKELFQAAVKSHLEYMSAATDGMGVDRHLFGLKKMLKEGEELPALYKDEAYGYSGSWYLSTSQLSSEYFNGYGWSQVLDAGFGIAYMINSMSINFNIVSKGLGSAKMSKHLAQAGDEMLALLRSDKPKAKL